MKRLTVIKLEPEDPNWQLRIEEAFNRVATFASELRSYDQKVPHSKARLFNMVVCNGEFSLETWQGLHAYGLLVVSRAIEGAKKHPQEVADSIDQAALNLRDVLAGFDLWMETYETQTK